MWPERLLDLELVRGEVFPRYLSARDRLWVQVALDEVEACVGRPRREALARIARPPGFGERPVAWQALQTLVLRLHRPETRACRSPSAIRAALFEEAARRWSEEGPDARARATDAAARRLEVAPEALLRDLYADLPSEQLLGPAREAVGAAELVERYNLALAQSLLVRCDSLEVRARAELRPAIRHAHLRRLLCEVMRDPLHDDGVVISLSGPLSLFHATTKYGRAMAAWLPALVGTPGWELEARVWLGGERHRFRASHRDGLAAPAAPPRRFDSALEERFFRELRRLAPAWRVLREADPVQVGRRILHPDFTLVDEARGLRVKVELVGFWTPEYLAAKREALARLPAGERWLLCVDEALPGGGADTLAAAAGGELFRFRRRIDVLSFLAFLERWLASSACTEATAASAGAD